MLDILKQAVVEEIYSGIVGAETGSITDSLDVDSHTRFIRTKIKAVPYSSSAYGPAQITYSFALDAFKLGWFEKDEQLNSWVKNKFLPHGRRLLNSTDSDKIFGLGQKGDLSSSSEDRQMYKKMALRLIEVLFEKNNGSIYHTVGEWRFGSKKKDRLIKDDAHYLARFAAHVLNTRYEGKGSGGIFS